MKEYERLTNQKWSEDIDLKQEFGYSHIYKRLYELENLIENGELVSKEWHDEQILHSESEVERLQAELDLAKAFHDEKCAEFNKLCYDYAKLKAFKEEYEKPIDKFIKDIEQQAVKEFAESVKQAFYYEFDELIPSIMSDKIDELVKEYTE